MRGTTILRHSKALCQPRAAITQHVVAGTRPSVAAAAALRAATASPATAAVPSLSYPAITAHRPLHTTRTCLAKKKQPKGDSKGGAEPAPQSGKGGRGAKGGRDAAPSSGSGAGGDGESGGSQHPTPNPEEPLDFADVRSRLDKASGRTVEALKKIRGGGRFNPEQLGALRVGLHEHHGHGASVTTTTDTFPLRELAQVVPKGGRTVSLLVHEEASVKAILSAVQMSPDFNQQPQRDPDNPLELILKVEPERREDVVKRVKALCHEWRERIRQVRQKRDKVHAQWKKDGVLLPDMKRKADTELDKVIKAKIAEVDAAEKETLKVVEAK